MPMISLSLPNQCKTTKIHNSPAAEPTTLIFIDVIDLALAPRSQAPPYAGEVPSIHYLRMRKVIGKFHRKIFRILVQTRGK